MKFIHTADWHIGNTFHGHDREIEHLHFLSWLLDIVRLHTPDALIVTGDVFDTANPSASAEAIYYEFLQRAAQTLPGLQIIFVAGNHDSGHRLEAPAPLLNLHNISVRGFVPRNEAGEIDIEQLVVPICDRESGQAAAVCLALPYLRTSDCPVGSTISQALEGYYEEFLRLVKKGAYASLPRIATGHFYVSGAEICEEEHSERIVVGGQERVDTNILSDAYSYIALGHIHKAQTVCQRPLTCYPGSALPMSFSEKRYNHGVNLVEISSGGGVLLKRLDYTPLRALTSIPQNGTASPDSVRFDLQRLPVRKGEDTGATWPYLEIRVREEQPEPELLAQATKLLADKAVHFCRMTAERHGLSRNESDMSIERLRTLTPLEMAQRVFKEQYGDPMPAEMEKRFLSALRDLDE